MSKVAMVLHDVTALFLIFIAICYVYFQKYLVVSIGVMLLMVIASFMLLECAKENLELLGEHCFSDIQSKDSSVFWSIPIAVIPIFANEFQFIEKIEFTQFTVMLIMFVVVFLYVKSSIVVPNVLWMLFGYHYYNLTIDGKIYTLISKNKDLKPFTKIGICKMANSYLLEKM